MAKGFTGNTFIQQARDVKKLNYIHMNPLAPHWLLVTDPCQYKYSSAGFYECNIKSFDFLKDVREEF